MHFYWVIKWCNFFHSFNLISCSLPRLTFPLSDRLTVGTDPWLFAYSAQRRSLYTCVCARVCVYNSVLFSVHVCRNICARVICVWTASRENIQPKIKTHLSASSEFVRVSMWVCVYAQACVYLHAHILCLQWVCAQSLEPSWDGEVYLVCVVNGDKHTEGGETGRSWSAM